MLIFTLVSDGCKKTPERQSCPGVFLYGNCGDYNPKASRILST